VTLHVPRRQPLGIFARLFGKAPHIRLRLDDLGSYVWSRCDGDTTVEHIIEEMDERFEADVADLVRRVALFLNRLARERLITWEEPS